MAVMQAQDSQWSELENHLDVKSSEVGGRAGGWGKANEQASAEGTGQVGNVFVKGRPGRRPGVRG